VFFKKKDKEEKGGYAKYAEGVNVDVMTEDGSYKLDLGALSDPAPTGVMALKRLYVISRDNIKLEDAQQIVMHAAMENPQYYMLLMMESAPLVWCAAYPDEIFGKESLPSLLLGYAKAQEGDKYLNDKSKLLPIEGKYNGYDYYLLALVH